MKYVKVLDLNITIQILGQFFEIRLEKTKGTITGNVDVRDQHKLFTVTFTAQLSDKDPLGRKTRIEPVENSRSIFSTDSDDKPDFPVIDALFFVLFSRIGRDCIVMLETA